MNREYIDSIIRMVANTGAVRTVYHSDTESGVFAQQLVIATFSELFRHEFPETKWVNGGLISLNTSIDEGAATYAFTELIASGRAAIVADNSNDLPAAEVTGRNNIRAVHTIADYVTYSTQEIRSSRMNGMFDIAQEKARSAREAMDRTLDDLIRSGSPQHSLEGIVNHTGIIVANAVTGNWQTATALQIVADVTTAINTIMNQSDGVETPVNVLFDVASFTRLSTLQNSVASDITVLDYLKMAFPMVTRWDWEPGLKDVSATGGASMLVYNPDPMKIRAVIPMGMRALPPQQDDLNFRLAFEMRFGGVMAPRPRSVLRLDGV